MSWLPGWDYCKKIVVDADSIDAGLTDFPITVFLNSANFDFTKAESDGADIRFTDGSLNQLKFERQEHSDVTPFAVYHVKVATVSSTEDTNIYMWYGNSAAEDTEDKAGVWDSNYKMVLHLGTSANDSTANGNNGTASGTTIVDTAYGKARNFDGTDDMVALTYKMGQDFTVITNIKFDTVSKSQYIHADWVGAYRNYLLRMGSDGKLGFVSGNGSNLQGNDLMSASALNTSDYFAIGFKRSGTDGFIYINSSQDATASVGYTADASPNSSYFGMASWYSDYIDGIVAEYRESNIARSSAWIKAESLSIKNGLLTISDYAELTTATRRFAQII